MQLGPFSAGAILGAIATLVGAGIPIYIRYIWGAKSHVSITRFATLDDSEWRDGRNEDKPVWSRRCLIKVSNSGWRDGVITDVSLSEVLVSGGEGMEIIQDPSKGVHKIEIEHYSEDTSVRRLDIQQRTAFHGQIIGGRDDVMMGVVPFILQESELGQAMKSADRGEFTFSFTVEDIKRVYYTDVKVQTSLEDSAGGKLKRND